MPPLKMRAFRNKGDVKRMMQRLMGSAATDLETFDPLTLGAFIAKADSFPGAFAAYQTIINVAAVQTWAWWASPADALVNNPAGVTQLHPKFWNPGQGVLPPTGQANAPAEDFLNGWYFDPEGFTLRYFDSANVAKNGITALLLDYGMNLAARAPGVISPGDSFVFGQRATAGTAHIQHFGCDPIVASGAGASTHPLYCIPLLPGHLIQFSGFTGLVDGDKVALNMFGRWRFNPRFIRASEEKNG